MAFVRIQRVTPLENFVLRLELTDGSVIERDVSALLTGPVFAAIRTDRAEFMRVGVEGGSVVWPGGADLCPDVLIHGGPPPRASETIARESGTSIAPA